MYELNIDEIRIILGDLLIQIRQRDKQIADQSAMILNLQREMEIGKPIPTKLAE